MFEMRVGFVTQLRMGNCVCKQKKRKMYNIVVERDELVMQFVWES